MSDFTQSDITTETYRIYHYGDGGKYSIISPVTLWRKTTESGDSHRILDAAGVTHCPAKGWVGISWSAPEKPVSF